MTKSQQKKVLNIQKEIEALEVKIDRLIAQRTLLEQQAQKLMASEPKERKTPTPEERQAQSLRDKQQYQFRLQEAQILSAKIKKLNLLGEH